VKGSGSTNTSKRANMCLVREGVHAADGDGNGNGNGNGELFVQKGVLISSFFRRSRNKKKNRLGPTPGFGFGIWYFFIFVLPFSLSSS